MNFGIIARVSCVAAIGIVLAVPAGAQDAVSRSQDSSTLESGGTMNLAPSTAFASAMSDEELGKQRGGFLGVAFSATFTGTIDSMIGDVTGSSTTTATSGVTSTNPPITFNLQGNSVNLSTYVGNLGNLNGVFAINTINGIGNIVNSHLTLNVALVTMNSGGAIPNLQSIFGQ